MSFPRYPKYKNSGVEWLGEVPAHWSVVQYKQFVDIQNGTDHKQVEQEEGYPVIGSGGVFAYASDFLFDGESVLLGRKGTIDKPLHVTGKFWTVDTMYWTKIKPVASGRFAYYVALTIPFGYYSTNTALPSMTKGDLSSHLVAQPPFLDQATIAAFLDYETAKIDALVAEQETLIALLKEKRQAVISHAVTKGLNPDAPMKDSGIEWLGEVPAHWEVARVKHFVQSLGQGWSPQCEGFPVESDDEWGVLKVGCVNGGRFNPLENKTLPSELEAPAELGIVADDLLISRANTRELVGSAAVAEQSYPNLLLCDKLYRVRLDKTRCLPSFFVLFLGSIAARGQIELAATGASSSMVNIGQGTILEMPLALPGVEEQESIADRINRMVSQLTDLDAEADAAIALLKERRSALISAAVTGKIDVRDFGAQKKAA
jgi:type I restriction enzyme S subunit